ncbi:conserved hypothetical protein [Histoplasma mississippiense (nom. inval.)]|uniref:conserved hypothetical protein n=1 Tax=Ajellomyces capsulatus (strain NAm1 / WU24) TaxID=2059318 RepID=UPI000157C713|nr:conserved hypothetical protein [Histoplasma mississippiense (nom. inval.)]EDN08146.1 conserved hypothetical protein [Histoplasma mississippiense (nom. inval.)]
MLPKDLQKKLDERVARAASHGFTCETLYASKSLLRLLCRSNEDAADWALQDLTVKYDLPTKPRERFMVTSKDIGYLLRGLFGDDWHDYKHKRACVQTGSALALFAGSGSRAGAVMESSAYCNSNECLYYRHLTFNIKSGTDGQIKRWVTIDAEFLKGWRYRDDKDLMVTPEGPQWNKVLSFSSLRHNFSSLAQREGFKDRLRVHGICGGDANCIDSKASEATHSQAFDHQSHDTYIKNQSVLKSLDIQALFYDLEPDYDCRNMEQSMAHHRDPNAPQKLDAAAIAAFEERDEIKVINERIAYLASATAGKPQLHKQLTVKRTQLHNRKSKHLEAWKKDFIQN